TVGLGVTALETDLVEDVAGQPDSQKRRDRAAIRVVEAGAGRRRPGEAARVGEYQIGGEPGRRVGRVGRRAVDDVVDAVLVVVERDRRREADPLLVQPAQDRQDRAGAGRLV